MKPATAYTKDVGRTSDHMQKRRYHALRMISIADLQKVARARLQDAKALCKAKRYDGATYLAGYAVEVGLKARICKSLGWKEFPETAKEFEGLVTFKTHKLPLLLRLSGREEVVKQKVFVEWSAVASWDPETRYRAVGASSKKEAELMIESAAAILSLL
ncbi:MAG: HEPN domain-containing protein [Acidobacteria bacterium]|nr:HEPN domain-containing protein [Acidobacteriota bacterium]